MEERDASPGHGQIDRNAVGDGDGEVGAGRGGDPTVDALDVGPSAAGADGPDLAAVDLIAQGERVGARETNGERCASGS